MKREDIEAIYPLSPLQHGLLFHSLYAPESGLYFEQISGALHGRLDVSAFERAWQQVIDRHSILRTSFHLEQADRPLQVVQRHIPLPLDRQDWRSLPPSGQQQRLAEFLESDRQR